MEERFRIGAAPAWIAGSLIVAGIGLTALAGDALFHQLALVFTVAICAALFVVTWHSRPNVRDPFFVFLGICSLGIGCMRALDVLAIGGAFASIGRGAGLHGALGDTARLMECAALAAAPLFVHRRIRPPGVLLVAVAILCLTIAATVLVSTFVGGPTPSLAVTVPAFLLCSVSLALLVARRASFDTTTFALIVAAAALRMAAQVLAVAARAGGEAWDDAAQIGSMAATFLLYRAVVTDAWRAPARVVIWEGREPDRRPKQTVVEVHTTRRLIPICMSCRKVRMDDGSWRSVEEEFARGKGVELSHGICPDCAERVYDEVVRDSSC